MEYSDAPLLSWSLGRRFRRNFCPRGAVLYYREARGGSDPDAAPEQRYLHGLRSRMSVQSYARRTISTVLRTMFYANAEPAAEPEELTPRVLAAFDRDFRRMLFGMPERDHALPMLAALAAPGRRPEDVRAEVERELRRRCAVLLDGAWPELFRRPPECRRHIASPLAVQINELRCYTAPLAALEAAGKLWIIDYRSLASGGEAETVLLHKFYALNSLARPPETVASFVLRDDDGDFLESDADFDVSDALRSISAEMEAWTDLLNTPDWRQISGNSAKCSECVFMTFCTSGGLK